MASLDLRIEQSLRSAHDAVARRGELLSTERLQQCYAAFRDRFGPDRLKSLDGEALLEAMHTHGNRESLVYWLEFKNDVEFPGPTFGSIAGGSAHKFGLFRRKDTGQWVTGSPQDEKSVSQAEAVVIARKHRDQLLAGVALLEELPSNSDDSRYRQLQEQLGQVAPDVCDLAWGHKYFSLLFPDKLDDYHNHRFQRFNLIKLLQLPPEQEGLYVAAGRFVSLAGEFRWPINHLTASLNERNGKPISYWRIGTRLGQKESIWPAMRDGGYVAIGWDALGDLSALADEEDLKEIVRKKLEVEYPNDPRVLSRKSGEIRNFVQKIAEGDVVIAADGENVVGLGRVTRSIALKMPRQQAHLTGVPLSGCQPQSGFCQNLKKENSPPYSASGDMKTTSLKSKDICSMERVAFAKTNHDSSNPTTTFTRYSGPSTINSRPEGAGDAIRSLLALGRHIGRVRQRSI